MRLDTYQHYSLKAAFNSQSARIRAHHATGSRLIAKGRKFRAKVRAKYGDARNDLIAYGMKMALAGTHIRDGADDGCREQCLALAFLNNRPYRRCEPTAETTPIASDIARLITPCLPKPAQHKAKVFIDQWLDSGVLRMSDFDGDLDRLLEVAAVEAAIQEAERSERRAKLHMKSAQRDLDRQTRVVSRTRADLDKQRACLGEALAARTQAEAKLTDLQSDVTIATLFEDQAA